MNYSIYIIAGILPSVIWLLFYLRKDVHPESKGMILKIFLYGMIAALPVIMAELGFLEVLDRVALSLSPFWISVLYWFLGVAFIEEFVKYLVIKGKVVNHSEFDEPVDLMLYMMIAALGFAALENILYLLPLTPAEVFPTSLFRFFGAIFLHALCSGSLGFFLALSFYETKHRGKLLILGMVLAVVLHGAFDFYIMEMKGTISFLMPILILVGLAGFVAFGFKKLKKIKSICKI
jgi:RsiW-degrading membrane proteinase PrsW (M82 family)